MSAWIFLLRDDFELLYRPHLDPVSDVRWRIDPAPTPFRDLDFVDYEFAVYAAPNPGQIAIHLEETQRDGPADWLLDARLAGITNLPPINMQAIVVTPSGTGGSATTLMMSRRAPAIQDSSDPVLIARHINVTSETEQYGCSVAPGPGLSWLDESVQTGTFDPEDLFSRASSTRADHSSKWTRKAGDWWKRPLSESSPLQRRDLEWLKPFATGDSTAAPPGSFTEFHLDPDFLETIDARARARALSKVADRQTTIPRPSARPRL
ncbi:MULTISPECIES: hypothetical protein [unclassified Thioalkalivibrio]|uniref:hypothetical protein n=1 Tax=unclassified Thioalkalivibrio TaxID=2621013 RepID=UPI00038074C6|nr:MULTISPECIES: hypothetical protein [unclassified Thioalkalivibrio]